MLSENKVEHVARLARLEFSEEDLEKFTEEFGRIVEMVEQLQEVDTEFVDPTYHGNRLTNVYREDIPVKSQKREQFLANAPMAEDGYIQVPVILESEDA